MPIRIVCRKCGYVLYDDNTPIPVVAIVAKYKGKCPKCKHKLSTNHFKMTIRPIKVRRVLR